MRFERLGVTSVGVFDFAPPLAVFGAEQVAQDREQPRRHIGAGLETVDMGEPPQQGFLHQVVGAVDITAQRNGECAKARHGGQDLIAYRRIELHALCLVRHYSDSSVLSRRSRSARWSGTP